MLSLIQRFQQGWGQFALVAAALLVVGLAEAVLQVSGFGREYDFVLEGDERHPGKACLNSQYIALHYFRHLPVNLPGLMTSDPWFPDTEFAIHKAPGVYRIVFLGASTTRGFPFEGRTINYARFLDLILRDVLPGRKVEVINAGYDALSSFGVLDLARSLVPYSPDLVVIYTGHNEFIGHFGVNSTVNLGQNRWVTDLVMRLHNSRLFLAGELIALQFQSAGRPGARADGRVNLFREMLSRKRLTWDAALHARALKNYRENLKKLVQLGREQGAGVVLMTPVSNLRDFPPLRSQIPDDLSETLRRALKKHLEAGRRAVSRQDWPLARQALVSALSLAPDHALAHFLLGRVLEHDGRKGLASGEYRRARDEDRVHLRACSEMQEAVRQIGREAGALVLDLDRRFERNFDEGWTGSRVFLEHVHPNINGHLLMADALAHFLARASRLAPESQWDFSRLKPARDYVRATGYNEAQFFQARYTIGRLLLDFPFYQCEAGLALLKEVGREREETALVQTCLQNRPGPA